MLVGFHGRPPDIGYILRCNELSARVTKWPSAVKTRRYDSPRRREQAAATRRAILEAAAAAVRARRATRRRRWRRSRAEAGVALKTVYVAFETKSGLLRALWHLRLRGDEEDVPIDERAVVSRGPRGARRRARAAARGAQARLVKERAGALLGVIRSAAPADADVAGALGPDRVRLLRQPARDRADAARARARCAGLDVARARRHHVDAQPPDVWRLLVGERGWTPERGSGGSPTRSARSCWRSATGRRPPTAAPASGRRA